MTYKDLQTALKAIKLRGLSDIPLNSRKEILENEYNRTKDLKTLREELADRVANGEVLYPVTEEVKEVEVTEVIYTESINHVLTSVFNSNYKVTVKEVLTSQNQTLKEFYSKLGLKLNIDPQVLLAKIDIYLNDKYLFFQHYHDHKETIKFNLATFKKELNVTEKQKKAIGIYTESINYVLATVYRKNHKVTTKEILNSIHIKVSDFVGNLTSTLGIKTTAFLDSLEDHLTAKYRRTESYLYNNAVIKSLVRHLTETVKCSN